MQYGFFLLLKVKLFIRLILFCNSIISDYKEDINLHNPIYLVEYNINMLLSKQY